MTDADDFAEALRLLRRWIKAMENLHEPGWAPWAETVALLARHPEPVKIKPCPFCGASAVMVKRPAGWVYVRCSSCCAQSSETSSEQATIAAWNRRALG